MNQFLQTQSADNSTRRRHFLKRLQHLAKTVTPSISQANNPMSSLSPILSSASYPAGKG
jgi:hypothetical protein